MIEKVCPACKNIFHTYFKNQKCCSYKCAVEIRPHKSIRDIQVDVVCDFQISPKCLKKYKVSNRNIERNRNRNNGKMICLYCSRQLKFSGRNNPNVRYKNLNDSFYKIVDSEAKAYLLGWIASDGSITEGSITIQIHNKDINCLKQIRNIIDPELKILKDKTQEQSYFSINSKQIVNDVCNLLSIIPGKKSHTVQFPQKIDDQYKWAFLRGYFDGDGCICHIMNKSPVCSIGSSSPVMLNQIKDFCQIPCSIYNTNIEWHSNNALDFLGKLYDNANFRLNRKYDLYIDWSIYVPGLGGKYNQGILEGPIQTKWVKTRKDAVPPSKTRHSDSGFDLTIIDIVKSFGVGNLYTTGIKIEPDYGWYYDVVPRSSISKTGYMMMNSLGIIDCTYRGEIMIALIKVDSNAPDLELPCRIAQLIPRPRVDIELVEVTDLDDTHRSDGGFGSTGV